MENLESPKNTKILFFLLALVAIICLSAIVFAVVTFLNASNKKTSANSNKFKLVVNTSKENIATTQKTLKVSGSTGTDSYVTILVGASQKIVKTNGNFSTSVDLVEGENLVNISAYNLATGESQTYSQKVLFLDEDLSGL